MTFRKYDQLIKKASSSEKVPLDMRKNAQIQVILCAQSIIRAFARHWYIW